MMQLDKPRENMPLNSSWIEYPDRELTVQVRADVLNEIYISAKVSFDRLKCLKADAALMGVPESKFWAWLQEQWSPEGGDNGTV